MTRPAKTLLKFVLALLALPMAPAQAQTSDDTDWTMAVRLGSADAYFSYLLRNPTGHHVPAAVVALRALGAVIDPDSALAAAEEAARRPPTTTTVRKQPKPASPTRPADTAAAGKPTTKKIY